MAGLEMSADAYGLQLLEELDHILSSDPLIDELGFVHPAQIAELQSLGSPGISRAPFFKRTRKKSQGSSSSTTESQGQGHCSSKTDPEVLNDIGGETEGESFDAAVVSDEALYDRTSFWCGKHKLAISVQALGPLYSCAKAAFFLSRDKYRYQLKQGNSLSMQNSPARASGTCSEATEIVRSEVHSTSAEETVLEGRLLNYSRALVLVNCDHATAWNMRKTILSHKSGNEKVLLAELHLASVVLSCGPKSEETWAHRRWVINKMITSGVSRTTLDSVLEGDSHLVETIAERSTMNYRAWRHRCWLVSKMSPVQIASELERTKLWATLHVGDNCCFHYRRCLLTRLVTGELSGTEGINNDSFCKQTDLDMTTAPQSYKFNIVSEELEWNGNLIRQYLGREALWIHRRFLMYISAQLHGWSLLHCPWKASSNGSCKGHMKTSEHKSDPTFAISEQWFLDSCLSACCKDTTEEAARQQEFSASYKLWIMSMYSQQQTDGEVKNTLSLSDKAMDIGFVLSDVAPHRQLLWEGLLKSR